MQLMKAIIVLVTLFFLFMRCDTKMQTEYLTDIEGETVKVTNNELTKATPSWSSDGSFLSFSENMNISYIATFFDSPNSKKQFMTLIPDINSRPALSPDGKYLAYASKEKPYLRTRSLIDGTENILTHSHSDVQTPAWSSDGSMIAYSAMDNNNTWNIWCVPAAGGVETQLTSYVTDCLAPSWSPDGTQIVYQLKTVIGNETYFNIWIKSLVGDRPLQLTNSKSKDTYPAWSPDGSTIAFGSKTNNRTSIFTISLEDMKEKRITAKTQMAFSPAWSPDGTKIAYISLGLIYICLSDSTNIYKISPMGMLYYPFWSADGNNINAVEYSYSSPTICVVSLEDFNIIPITLGDKELTNTNPHWLNNNDLVFYKNYSIYKIHSTGGQICPVLSDESTQKNNIELSSNNTLAFDNGNDIFIQSLFGGEIINLTDHIDIALTQPTWSPDCKNLACRSSYGLGIYKIDSDKLIEKSFIPGYFFNPDWSNEISTGDSHLAFERYGNIYSISPDTHKEKLIVYNAEYPCWSPDGKRLAYVQNNNIFYKTIFMKLN